MKRVIAAIEVFSTWVGYVGAWVLAPLIVSMVYEVIARHIFGAPTFWAYEVGYMLAGTSYMCGMAYCMKVGGHVRVDFIYNHLSLRHRAIIDFFGYIILLLPGALWVTWGLYDYALESYVSGEVSGESAWNPVIWPFRTVWVIGFIAICLQTVAEAIKAGLILFSGIEEEAAA